MSAEQSPQSPASLSQELHVHIEPAISQEALKNNEFVAAFPDYLLRDRESSIANPGKVRRRVFVAPSAWGKSTISGQMARANENDRGFQRKLALSPTGKRKPFYSFHISLSQALEVAAEEDGKTKDEVSSDEGYRVRATELMLDGLNMVDQAFTDHPDYNAELSVDTVGITRMDLGRHLIETLADDPLTRFFGIIADERVEQEGLSLRESIRQNPELADKYFKTHQVDPGRSFQENVDEFIRSCGTRSAWERHFTDILEQMKESHFGPAFYRGEGLALDAFLQDFDLRSALYKDWLPLRMQELGVDASDPSRFEIIQNTYIPFGIHTHFERLNRYERKVKGKKKRHVPLELVMKGQDKRPIEADEILSQLGEPLQPHGTIFSK